MIFPVYVDASDACNNMDFQFGNNGFGTTIPTRSWSIKVLKYRILKIFYYIMCFKLFTFCLYKYFAEGTHI